MFSTVCCNSSSNWSKNISINLTSFSNFPVFLPHHVTSTHNPFTSFCNCEDVSSNLVLMRDNRESIFLKSFLKFIQFIFHLQKFICYQVFKVSKDGTSASAIACCFKELIGILSIKFVIEILFSVPLFLGLGMVVLSLAFPLQPSAGVKFPPLPHL